jgi:cell division protein FtsI (penicillin-binding protein 3)
MTAASRRASLYFILSIGFGIVLCRALFLQIFQHEFLRKEGMARYARTLTLYAHRGSIVDRNGYPLAVSSAVYAIAASPKDIRLTNEKLAWLASLIHQDTKNIAAKLSKPEREFVYLARGLPPSIANRIADQKIPGIMVIREFRRYYPAGEVIAPLLGFTDIDGNGIEGIEYTFNDTLKGENGAKQVIRDHNGLIIEDAKIIRPVKDGTDLTLSLDFALQYHAYKALANAVQNSGAKKGALVLLDAKTGEALALVSYPSYNPNNYAARVSPYRKHNALNNLLEPGSTIKPFTIAAALQSGRFRPQTLLNIGGSFSVPGGTVRDTHTYPTLTVSEVIQKSSNIGAAKIALATPKDALWQVLHDTELTQKALADFPGIPQGILRPWKTWRPIEHATIAFGYGISMNLFNLVRAYSVFANDGKIVPATIQPLRQPLAQKEVLDPKIAQEVRAMLEKVVLPGGTGTRAAIPGYRVAGKTGTAQKRVNGRYQSKQYLSLFVGFAPAGHPAFLCGVVIDDPKGAYYGGVVAAPAFTETMNFALRKYNIPPDDPQQWIAQHAKKSSLVAKEGKP